MLAQLWQGGEPLLQLEEDLPPNFSILMWMSLSMINASKKNKTLRICNDKNIFRDIYSERGGVLTGSQICAGGEPGQDSCVGDSGSGLMREIKVAPSPFHQYHLIGVVSFGPRLCGTKGVPGVYSRVNSFLDWILDTVQNN